MPFYDRKCPSCEEVYIDCFEPIATGAVPCKKCGQPTERVWIMGSANSVIGDEVDVWIRNGIYNDDGTPRHYTSKAEMARVAKEKGLVNRVEHIGTRSSDKSKHTTRWY